MVIWSGWGILVIPVVFLVSLLVGASLQWLLAPLGRPELVFVASAAGLLAAAAANWWVGRRLNGQPGRVLVDPRTGEEVVLRRAHTLFWIRMEYWSVPVALLALLPLGLLALRLLGGPQGGPVPAGAKGGGAVTGRALRDGTALAAVPLPPTVR